MKHYDIIVVGGGMVGLTLACALGKSDLKIAVVEAHAPKDVSPENEYGLRVSAISRASQQVFIHIGAWQHMLARRVSPYEHMHVWDATGDGQIHFSAADLGADVLGHIVENNVVQF
ncbi:MAG: NAD(P)-binding protein, partial [Gammaproteobacteria bacterium]|nr:NAD(P)-binding protein [Gammaproteobacteria bacterium]